MHDLLVIQGALMCGHMDTHSMSGGRQGVMERLYVCAIIDAVVLCDECMSGTHTQSAAHATHLESKGVQLTALHPHPAIELPTHGAVDFSVAVSGGRPDLV
jgi:hypothetical protein